MDRAMGVVELGEGELYRPSADIIQNANVKEYDELYRQSLQDPEQVLATGKDLVGVFVDRQAEFGGDRAPTLLFEQAAQGSRSFFGRWVARLELPRTRRYERALVGSFPATLVTSANDKAALERLTRRSQPQVCVLPNGVDSTYFCPGDGPKTTTEVVFSGKLSYHANVTAALHLVQQVMPFVWADQPEARVVLAGKDPASELVRLGQADRRVVVTGTVDDLRPYLRRATVAAAARASDPSVLQQQRVGPEYRRRSESR